MPAHLDYLRYKQKTKGKIHEEKNIFIEHIVSDSRQQRADFEWFYFFLKNVSLIMMEIISSNSQQSV